MTHTPGPWSWRGYPGRLRLAGRHPSNGLDATVMDFERRGMQSAGPRFNTDGLMDSADDFLRFEVAPDVKGYQAGRESNSVYRYDVIDVDHPDARLIAAAPDLLAALQDLLAYGVDMWDAHEHRLAVERARAAIARASAPGGG